jgi:hypothetical protein
MSSGEREKCGAPRRNIFTTGGPQSLVGNPVPRDESESRTSARILRKWERDHSSACEEDSLREDLEGRLASAGWWLEVQWGRGSSLWACERVVLSRIRGSGKAVLVPEEGNGSKERYRGMGSGRPGEQVQCQELTQSESRHQMLGEMPCIKKAHEKISCPRAGLMTSTSHLADPGKMVQKASRSRPGMAFYRRGRVRSWHMCTGPWWGWILGGACLGAQEILLKGRVVIGNGSIFQYVKPEDKMAADL